jgi:hypothetical protein
MEAAPKLVNEFSQKVASLGFQAPNFDLATNSFLKLLLYRGISLESKETSEIFLDLLKKTFDQDQKSLFHKLFLFTSYHYFIKKFTLLVVAEAQKRRASWLLQQSDVLALAGLELKNLCRYFYDLEKQIFENDLCQFQKNRKFLFVEFQKARGLFSVSLLKKYGHLFIAWIFILIAIASFLFWTEKENPLSLWEQFLGWINFLFLRSS